MLPNFNITGISRQLKKAREREQQYVMSQFIRKGYFDTVSKIKTSQGETETELHYSFLDPYSIDLTPIILTAIQNSQELQQEKIKVRESLRKYERELHVKGPAQNFLSTFRGDMNNPEDIQNLQKIMQQMNEREKNLIPTLTQGHRDSQGKLTAPKVNPGSFWIFEETYPDLFRKFWPVIEPVTIQAIRGLIPNPAAQIKLRTNQFIWVGALAAAFINDEDLPPSLNPALSFEIKIPMELETWDELAKYLGLSIHYFNRYQVQMGPFYNWPYDIRVRRDKFNLKDLGE